MYETCLVLPVKARANPPRSSRVSVDRAGKQDSPPVYVKDKPDMTVYTRRVGGYVWSDEAWAKEASSLKKLLQDRQVDADFSTYYRNAYDGPMRLLNRRQEIWYVKNEAPSTAAAAAVESFPTFDPESDKIPIDNLDEGDVQEDSAAVGTTQQSELSANDQQVTFN